DQTHNLGLVSAPSAVNPVFSLETDVTHPELSAFPVVVELDVAWADMDSFAHVNNVVYFRYFENARVAYLDRVGWFAALRDQGVGPIVHSTNARFRRPLSYPDRVLVG